MSNTFQQLLDGEVSGDKLEINLKSTVPIFIAYPELIIPFKARISDIVPYYKSEEDYNDIRNNLLLPNVTSPTPLIVLFTKVFEMIVKLYNSGSSQLEHMPAVTLKIDIGGSPTQFETVAPSKQMIEEFDSSKAKMFTFTGYNAAGQGQELTDTQKHNLLLVDMLTRKYNNSGIGGRR